MLTAIRHPVPIAIGIVSGSIYLEELYLKKQGKQKNTHVPISKRDYKYLTLNLQIKYLQEQVKMLTIAHHPQPDKHRNGSVFYFFA